MAACRKNKVEIEPRCIIERLSTRHTCRVGSQHGIGDSIHKKPRPRTDDRGYKSSMQTPCPDDLWSENFGKFSHISIVEYIRQLQDSTRPGSFWPKPMIQLRSVAEKSGFSTYNYMNHVFRSMTGVSPAIIENSAV